MMAVSPDNQIRRRRYTRRPAERPVALTPSKLDLLQAVAEFGIASLPQLAALAGASGQSARRHLRVLFDAGLVNVVPVARVALADVTRAGDASLLYGSAPNLYTLTRAGGKVLEELGRGEGAVVPPRYGPHNSLFLAHELAVRDVRVWLELSARRRPDQRLERWVDGSRAVIDLKRSQPPRQARPDAWFVYRIGGNFLVGLLEVDRGTERGSRRWEEKLATYAVLLRSERLRETTGYARARVLTLTPNERRRDHLAALVAKHAPAGMADRFWFATREVLTAPGIHQVGWRPAGSSLLLPLLPAPATPLPPRQTVIGGQKPPPGSNPGRRSRATGRFEP
jgi:hypothetical protein